MLVAAILLLYPGYGALFHEFSSDALSAAGFALWALAAVRVSLRPSAARFLLLGVGVVALVLIRPGNQVLLAFGLAPLVLGGLWRARFARSGAFLGAAVGLLALWAGHNAVRYEDFAVARGTNIALPFFRAFAEDTIVSPENGPASRRLARAVEERLLTEEPYRSYGIDLDEFFSSGSDRMMEDVASLTDRVFGWDSDYAILRDVGLEAVREHPGTYAAGVVAHSGGFSELPPTSRRGRVRATTVAVVGAKAKSRRSSWSGVCFQSRRRVSSSRAPVRVSGPRLRTTGSSKCGPLRRITTSCSVTPGTRRGWSMSTPRSRVFSIAFRTGREMRRSPIG